MATPHTTQHRHTQAVQIKSTVGSSKESQLKKYLEKMHCAVTGTAHSVYVLNHPPKNYLKK